MSQALQPVADFCGCGWLPTCWWEQHSCKVYSPYSNLNCQPFHLGSRNALDDMYCIWWLVPKVLASAHILFFLSSSQSNTWNKADSLPGAAACAQGNFSMSESFFVFTCSRACLAKPRCSWCSKDKDAAHADATLSVVSSEKQSCLKVANSW